MRNIGILSTGHSAGSRILTNDDLASMLRSYDAAKAGRPLSQWYLEHYGIEQRRWSTPDEVPSIMATKAAEIAISRAKLTPQDIDFIVLNTASGDYQQPTTATSVQRNLGMRKDTFAMEINMPCAGPIFDMASALGFMTGVGGERYRYGLAIGVDMMTSKIDMNDFVRAGLFGDAAGAVVLSPVKAGGILDYVLGSKGEEGEEKDYALLVPAGGAARPPSYETVDQRLHDLKMNGKKVHDFATVAIKDTINVLLKRNNITQKDISYIVPHQGAQPLVLDGTRHANIPDEKVVFTVGSYGNTGGGSVLVTLDKLYSEIRLKEGELVILVGMGAGLTWGGMLYEATNDFIREQ